MEEDDNITKQADEVEALSAIYGDEWCIVDEAARICCIKIKHETEKGHRIVNLQVILPPDYPSSSPPQYQLNAPWLRGDQRIAIQNALEDVYSENVGESIIYQWVEAIREYLQGMDEHADSTESSHSNVTMTTETDFTFDEDFDPSVYVPSVDLSLFHEEQLTASEECPEISHGEPLADRRSVFQAHLAPVKSKAQVKLVLNTLCENKKIANATHNIYAYRIAEPNKSAILTGCFDDGETHAGSRMLHLLSIVDVMNVIVVVSRWYGGIHLGPDRFKHINNCTRTILEQCNYISKDKGDKKSQKGSKKR